MESLTHKELQKLQEIAQQNLKIKLGFSYNIKNNSVTIFKVE